MSDDRDLSWLGPPEPAPKTYPEAVVWRVTKGRGIAEARVRDVPRGHELMLMVDGGDGQGFEMAWTWSPVTRRGWQACQTGALQDFQRLGWDLCTDDERPQ